MCIHRHSLCGDHRQLTPRREPARKWDEVQSCGSTPRNLPHLYQTVEFQTDVGTECSYDSGLFTEPVIGLRVADAGTPSALTAFTLTNQDNHTGHYFTYVATIVCTRAHTHRCIRLPSDIQLLGCGALGSSLSESCHTWRVFGAEDQTLSMTNLWPQENF